MQRSRISNMRFTISSRNSRILAAVYSVASIAALLSIAGTSRDIFPVFTPLAMMLIGIGSVVLTYELTGRTVGALSGAIVFLFLCQALGANTGFPFGDFAYTNRLGPKVFDVPLLMPFAWFSLLIPAWVSADKVLKYRNVIIASLIVTAVDALLEFAADTLDLWHWQGGLPTELNSLSWFGVSYVVFTILSKNAKEKELSPIVPHLLLAQILYFAFTDLGLHFLVHSS